MNNQIYTLSGHKGYVTCILPVESNSDCILSAGWDKSIRAWSLKRRECDYIFMGHTGHIKVLLEIKFRMNNLLLSAADDRTMRLWQIDNGECLHIFESQTSPLSVELIRNTSPKVTLALASDDRTLRIGEIV